MSDGAAGPGADGVDAAARGDDGAGPGETETVALEFGDDGLVPAVAQDAETGEVLMLAYASPEAVARSRETGRAHYYSRSRDELWEKGATSGHTQSIREIRVDCDADAVLYLVEQAGGACHTGFHSCFHRTVRDATRTGGATRTDAGTDGDPDEDGPAPVGLTVEVALTGERAFDPDEVY